MFPRLMLPGRIYLVTVLSSMPEPVGHVIRARLGIAAGLFGWISGGIPVQPGFGFIDSGIYP